MNQSWQIKCCLKAVSPNQSIDSLCGHCWWFRHEGSGVFWRLCVSSSPEIGQSEWTLLVNQTYMISCFSEGCVCCVNSRDLWLQCDWTVPSNHPKTVYDNIVLTNQSWSTKYCLKAVHLLQSTDGSDRVDCADESAMEDQVVLEDCATFPEECSDWSLSGSWWLLSEDCAVCPKGSSSWSVSGGCVLK